MTKVYITESGYKLNVASTLRMTASEAETLLDGVFEPVLGNPGTNGYVLSSTTAGVRSWVAQSGGGGASDVGDLTTTSGSSTNMLRVAAAGGLEYRTTAQVLSDIGAAPTASPTFTGTVTLPTTVASVIKPASDSTTALKLTKADGVTSVLTVDTTNSQLILNPTSVDAKGLIIGASAMPSGVSLYIENGTPDFRQKIVRASGGLASNFMNVWVKNSTTNLETEAFAFGTLANVQNGATPPSISYIYMSSLASPAYNNANFFMLPSGYIGIGTGNNAPTARLDIAASTTAAASLRIRSGTAPTSPNAGDIWNDGTDFNLYGSGLKLHTGVIKPSSDSTTALQLANAAGAAVLTVDTTNKRVGIGGNPGTVPLLVELANGGAIAQLKSTNAGRSTYLDFINNDGVRGLFGCDGSGFTGVTGQFVIATWSAHPLKFFVNQTERAQLSTLGYFGVGTTPTAYADLAASTTAAASLRIRSGTAPTSPNDGDIWYDGSNLKIRIGATTYSVDVTAV